MLCQTEWQNHHSQQPSDDWRPQFQAFWKVNPSPFPLCHIQTTRLEKQARVMSKAAAFFDHKTHYTLVIGHFLWLSGAQHAIFISYETWVTRQGWFCLILKIKPKVFLKFNIKRTPFWKTSAITELYISDITTGWSRDDSCWTFRNDSSLVWVSSDKMIFTSITWFIGENICIKKVNCGQKIYSNTLWNENIILILFIQKFIYTLIKYVHILTKYINHHESVNKCKKHLLIDKLVECFSNSRHTSMPLLVWSNVVEPYYLALRWTGQSWWNDQWLKEFLKWTGIKLYSWLSHQHIEIISK